MQLGSAEKIDAAAKIVREFAAANEAVTESPTEAVVRIQTSRSENELGLLLEKLVEAKAGVTQFRELQTSLEDAFLSVAGADASVPKSVPAAAPKTVDAATETAGKKRP